MKDLALITFSTSQGHETGHTYRDSILSMKNQLGGDMSIFKSKLAHWKMDAKTDNLNELSASHKKFFEEENFKVVASQGSFNHHDFCHGQEYYRDIKTCFSQDEVLKCEFALWFEDDWVFDLNGVDLSSVISESVKFLKDNPRYLCVRFNTSYHKENHHDFDFLTENICRQGSHYTKFGDTFTFQPTIVRTMPVFAAWRNHEVNSEYLKRTHCELLSGSLLKNFSLEKTPFCFYNSEKILSKHIG